MEGTHKEQAQAGCHNTVSKPLVKCVQVATEARGAPVSAGKQASLPEEATFSTDSGSVGLSEEANASNLQILSPKQTWKSESTLLQVKPTWGK